VPARFIHYTSAAATQLALHVADNKLTLDETEGIIHRLLIQAGERGTDEITVDNVMTEINGVLQIRTDWRNGILRKLYGGLAELWLTHDAVKLIHQRSLGGDQYPPRAVFDEMLADGMIERMLDGPALPARYILTVGGGAAARVYVEGMPPDGH
jgi:hypothetical protein